MAPTELRTGGFRPGRLLSRALVVLGATAAGTSAAWLLGTGTPAQAADPGPASFVDTVLPGDTALPGVDALPGLSGDALSAVDGATARLGLDRPAQALLGAAEPVTGVLRESADEVGKVAGRALTGAGEQAEELGSSVGLAPAEPGPAVGPALEPGRPAPAARPALPEPEPAPEPAPQPPAPAPPSAADTTARVVLTEPAAQPAEPAPGPAQDGPAQDDPARDRPVHEGPGPFVLPAPAGAGCAVGADGPQHGGSALGWHPVDRLPGRAGPTAAAREAASLPTGLPEPQPGTTPD
ncbi:hypothetical protein [Saccharopolyspora sp. CA-218241]|uniref:hypothetical protein n=1 Tax=Saccharopolyspora sp. CA-218241 TaxID=3240027 RepID=UPI003D95FCB9